LSARVKERETRNPKLIIFPPKYMQILKFVTGRPLWVNMLAGILLVFLAVVIFMLSLNWCTDHGKTLTIPAVVGMPYDKAKELLETKGFDVEIQDSVYFDTMPPLNVLKQFPESDAVVKKNRTVYLTVNRVVPPTIEMPQLVNLTFRNADVTLRQYGLRLGDTLYRVDFAKNAVLDQLYNGESIKTGTKIQMGSSIDLVLGTGVTAYEFAVPDLFGLTLEEAKTLLQANGLAAAEVIALPEVTDTSSAFVYRQDPPRTNEEGRINRIRGGQTITLWVQLEKPLRIIDTAKAVMPPKNDY
jgi:eukaryotic-like serine/threonine-protein kinase